MKAPALAGRGLRRTVGDLTRSALAPFFKTDLCVVDAYHGAKAGVSRSGFLFWQMLSETPGLRSRRVVPGKPLPLDLGAIETTLWLANSRDLPRTQRKLSWLAQQSSRQIGYWYFELDQLPDEEASAAQGLSEVWVASEFVATSVRKACELPVRIIPPPVLLGESSGDTRADRLEASAATSAPRTADRFLVSLDAYSSVERKNPWVAIEAFRRVFQGQSEKHLTIRVSRPEGLPSEIRSRLLDQQSDQVSIHLETFPTAAEAHRFMAGHDVYISPHRSEGLGLHLVEAILLGLPVIATGYGGNMDFCDPDGVDLIAFDLIPGNDPQGLYTGSFAWAEPDLDHLSTLLLTVSRRTEADHQARQKKALGTLLEHFDTERLRGLVRDRLEDEGRPSAA